MEKCTAICKTRRAVIIVTSDSTSTVCLLSFCRDLKAILSQRCKVLIVNEPRMVRAALVYFDSYEDLERAQASFRNTQVLGSIVDIVPVRPLCFEGSIFTCHVDFKSLNNEGSEGDTIMASHACFYIQP
jgi:hypothetical protein